MHGISARQPLSVPWLGVSCLILALGSGCGKRASPSPSGAPSASTKAGSLTPELAAKVLAKIGGREITLGDYAATLERMDPFERLRYQSPDRRKQLLNEIVQVELLAQEAKRRGLDKLPETEERLRQMLRDELLRDVRRDVPSANDIPEADVRAYYAAHHDDFREPERRRVSHIVVASEEKAQLTLAKAAHLPPIEWGKLVLEYSLDKPHAQPTALELAGDLGIVGPPGHPRGGNPRVPEPLRTAVFAIAEVGGVYPQVVSEGGKFHVVRLTGRTEPRDRSYEEAERTIRVSLVQQRIHDREQRLEQDLRQKYPVTVDDAALARVALPERDAPPPRAAKPGGSAP